MKNNAIVILFVGSAPTDEQIREVMNTVVDTKICVPEMLEVKVLDSDAIAQSVVGSCKNTSEHISKIAVVKAVKNHLGLSLKEAKDMVDNSGIDLLAKVSLLKDMMSVGRYPTLTNASTDEIMAKMASGVFLSKRYGEEGKIKLITDYLESGEKPESLLSASEKALRNAITIVSEMSEEEAKAFDVPSTISKVCYDLKKCFLHVLS